MKLGYKTIENVGAMLTRAPDLTYTYVRQELQRFANRFKKKLARERMSGRPGINWYGARTLKNSKHFKYYVEGTNIKSLAMVSKISGTLMAHETGATIRAKPGGWLYIIDRKAKYAGATARKLRAKMGWTAPSGIVGKVKQVVIPARLEFRKTFRTMLPEEKARLNKAIGRALQVASERNAKTVRTMMDVKI